MYSLGFTDHSTGESPGAACDSGGFLTGRLDFRLPGYCSSVMVDSSSNVSDGTMALILPLLNRITSALQSGTVTE